MTAILPGACIGIVGAGQLARMLALEARRMGYGIAVLDPDPAPPAASLADEHIRAPFDDPQAAAALARCSAVVTCDTEHVPAEILAGLEASIPVRPSAAVLGTVQDRWTQRRFLAGQDAPQVRHAAVSERGELHDAAARLGLPAVLKTRRAGYDGKGQQIVHTDAELDGAWRALGRAPSVLEEFVEFSREISVLLARDVPGNIEFYPCAENLHRDHILALTRVPARLPPALEERARDVAAGIASSLGHVGMMAVELFVLPGDELLVNEIAPRTHNSGHFSFGGCVTSQFEQHLRAICGLPLGEPTLMRAAVMLNLLGDLWRNGPPDWHRVLDRRGAQLHLYDKREARAGRKMGHVLLLDDDQEAAAAGARAIAAALRPGPAAPRA